MRRRYKLPLIALATLLFLIALLLSEAGTRWLLRDGLPRIAPGLQIGAVEGPWGKLRLSDVRFQSDSVQVHIQRLDMDWLPARAALDRHLQVSRLLIEDVTLKTLPQPEKVKTPVQLNAIELPFSFDCQDCQIARVHVINGDEKPVVIERVQLRAASRANRLVVSQLNLSLPEPKTEAQLSGTLALTQDYPLDLTLSWSLTDPEKRRWRGQGRFNGSLKALSFTQQLSEPQALQLGGVITDPLNQPNAALKAQWQQLRWPLEGEPEAQLLAGELTLSGGLEQFTWALTSGFTTPGVPLSRWQAHGQGSAEQLTIEQALIAALEGQLRLSGLINWRDALKLDLKLAAQDLNPVSLAPEWPGKLALTAELQGELGEKPALDFKLQRLEGTLRGEALKLSSAGTWRGEELSLPELTARYGTATLSGHLRYSPARIDSALKLDAPQLDGLWPDARGAVNLSLAAQGQPERLNVSADATLRALQWGSNAVQALSLTGTLKDGKTLDLRMVGQALTLGESRLQRASLQLSGSEAQHQLALELRQSAAQAVTLQLSGQLTERERWQGQLVSGQLTVAELGQWQLAAKTLNLALSGSRIEQLCLRQDSAKLCADASAKDGANWTTQLQLHELPLALLSRLNAPELKTDSVINLRAEAGSEAGQLKASAKGALSAGELRYPLPGSDEVLTLPHQGAALSGTLAGNTAKAELAFSLDDRQGAELVVTLNKRGDDWTAANNSLAGTLRANLERLDWLTLLAPGLEKPAGTLQADLAIGGTLSQPAINGQATLAKAEVDLPAVGLALRDLALSIDGSPDGLTLQGSARSGKGTLTLAGRAAPLAEGHPLTLTLQGERFQAANLAEAKVWISPDLVFDLQGDVLAVSGTLTVPEAAITPNQLPASAVKPSEDVVFVDEAPAEQSAAGLQTRADVRLVLGDKVLVDAFGLDAQLGGSLRIRQTGRTQPSAQGELNVVKGKYEAYGQDLTITKGRLIFMGAVTNPMLDLEAVRKFTEPEKLTVGIRGKGNVRKPDLRLFADKAMEERDMLSYLIIGRPLGEAEGADGQMLSNAALNMGLTGAAGLAQSVGERLGLANTTITTKGKGEDTAIVVGTWLAPSLYMDYGSAVMGSKNAGALWSLQYFFTKQLKIEATGGVQNAVDLKYTIERD